MTNKTYNVTEAMVNNQDRAIGLIEKYGKQIEVSKLKPMTLNEVKKQYFELTKLEKAVDLRKRDHDGCLNSISLEFLSKGGSAALAWSRFILKQEGILKSFSDEINPEVMSKEDNLPSDHLKITKALNEELKQVTYVAMIPDSVDAHGDYTSEQEVRKAKESFNRALLSNQKLSNLFHIYETNTFDVIESYLAPCDMVLNGHFVAKSTWLMTLQVNDDALWEMVKKGEVVGLSIGAIASVENLDE